MEMNMEAYRFLGGMLLGTAMGIGIGINLVAIISTMIERRKSGK